MMTKDALARYCGIRTTTLMRHCAALRKKKRITYMRIAKRKPETYNKLYIGVCEIEGDKFAGIVIAPRRQDDE